MAQTAIENKSLIPDEQKENGVAAPKGEVTVVISQYHEKYVPGQKVNLPAAKAGTLIAAGYARPA